MHDYFPHLCETVAVHTRQGHRGVPPDGEPKALPLGPLEDDGPRGLPRPPGGEVGHGPQVVENIVHPVLGEVGGRQGELDFGGSWKKYYSLNICENIIKI